MVPQPLSSAAAPAAEAGSLGGVDRFDPSFASLKGYSKYETMLSQE